MAGAEGFERATMVLLAWIGGINHLNFLLLFLKRQFAPMDDPYFTFRQETETISTMRDERGFASAAPSPHASFINIRSL